MLLIPYYTAIFFVLEFVDVESGLLELFKNISGVRIFLRHSVCVSVCEGTEAEAWASSAVAGPAH